MATIITLALCYIVFLWMYKAPVKYLPVPLDEMTMTEKARQDLSVVGHYDIKYTTSLKFLLEDIYLRLYFLCDIPFDVTWKSLKAWADMQIDPDGKTVGVVLDVCKNLNEEIQNAKKEKREPEFHIDLEQPIPAPSKSLRCNDYCDLDGLIDIYKELAK